MNSLDRIQAMLDQLQLKLKVMPPNYAGSRQNHLLTQVEAALRIAPRGQLGTRIAYAESQLLFKTGFRVGDKVRYVGGLLNYAGRTGVVTRQAPPGVMVRFPLDRSERFFQPDSLRKENDMNIINAAKATIMGFFTTAAPSTVEQAASELLAATTLVSVATSKKERAKKALVTLGIILPEYREGTVRAYDSGTFTIEAVTKAPASRLDQSLLVDALIAKGLTRLKANAAIAAATVENKAATSIVVTQK